MELDFKCAIPSGVGLIGLVISWVGVLQRGRKSERRPMGDCMSEVLLSEALESWSEDPPWDLCAGGHGSPRPVCRKEFHHLQCHRNWCSLSCWPQLLSIEIWAVWGIFEAAHSRLHSRV